MHWAGKDLSTLFACFKSLFENHRISSYNLKDPFFTCNIPGKITWGGVWLEKYQNNSMAGVIQVQFN